MNNPWTKRNPLMSMWLSAANRSVAPARGQIKAAATRQVHASQAEATRQFVAFWSGEPLPKAKKRKPRR